MELQNFPRELAFFAWVLFAILIIDTLRRLIDRRHEFLPESIQQHAWMAGIVALGMLWSLAIDARAGLQLTMIGVPLFALLFGFERALVGGAIALLGFTALSGNAWPGVGLHGLLVVVFPAALTAAMQTLLASMLPRHLFVFIIGNGLFVTLLGAASAGAALVAAQIAFAPPGAVPNAGEIIGSALLLAWGEALASGMVFSALVIFCPQIVLTYAIDEYLPRR